jgi:hypothetical protein
MAVDEDVEVSGLVEDVGDELVSEQVVEGRHQEFN